VYGSTENEQDELNVAVMPLTVYLNVVLVPADRESKLKIVDALSSTGVRSSAPRREQGRQVSMSGLP
jgi:hypothetical protein